MENPADSIIKMIEDKSSKAYLACVKKGDKKAVEKIEGKLKQIVVLAQDVKKNKEGKKDVKKLVNDTIKMLQLTKDVMAAESDKSVLRYGAEKCTNEYVDRAVFRSKQQQAKLDDSMALLKVLAKMKK